MSAYRIVAVAFVFLVRASDAQAQEPPKGSSASPSASSPPPARQSASTEVNKLTTEDRKAFAKEVNKSAQAANAKPNLIGDFPPYRNRLARPPVGPADLQR